MKDRFLVTDNFIESVSYFDKNLKSSLWKCLQLLCKNFLHPSLNTEKLNGIYSSRINIDYRLIHEPLGELFRLLFAGKHEDAYRFAENYKQREVVGRRIISEPSVKQPMALYKISLTRKEKRMVTPANRVFRFLLTKFGQIFLKPKIGELLPYQEYNLRELKRYLM